MPNEHARPGPHRATQLPCRPWRQARPDRAAPGGAVAPPTSPIGREHPSAPPSALSRRGGHRPPTCASTPTSCAADTKRRNPPPTDLSFALGWLSSTPGRLTVLMLDLARFDVRIIRAMQSSGPRGTTVECVALRSCGVRPADVCLHDCDNATRPALTAALVYPPRVVRRRGRLLTAAGCEPEQALHRSRVTGASPREAALLLPRRPLRAAPTPASSRGCTRLARAARRVVLVHSGSHGRPGSGVRVPGRAAARALAGRHRCG